MKPAIATRIATGCLLATLGAFSYTGAAVAAGSHDHGSAATMLKLNNGAKWETDGALRSGMEAIRSEIAQALPAVHAKRYAAAQYEALGQAVEQQLAYIVQNCKLTPAADEVLHGVIAEIGKGVDVVAGRKAIDDRSRGVVHLVRALDDYGTYFAHPGWERIETGH